MRTKTIFKTVALAMMMPAMLLTSACSSEDDLVNNTAENTEAVANKGYALPVTVNVTRQGDGTRATFDGSKLNFGAGDKLFVYGSATAAGSFAGELDYVPATGKFNGTIYTQNKWTGTPDALFAAASTGENLTATLLPNGYDANGNNSFLSINNNSTTDIAYDDRLTVSYSKAFVASETAKATGVEQLSWEQAINNYNSGFALSPGNAILNFTITGLAAGAQNVSLQIQYGIGYTVSGSVTPNASGVATFAVGAPVGANIKEGSNNLIVGSSNFTLPSSTTFAVGKIYNITRSAGPTYPSISTVTTSDYGKVVCAAGHLHDANTPVPSGCTGVGVIAKVTDGGHGLIMSLQDAEENCWTNIKWCTSVTYAGSTMKRLDEWMFDDCLPSYTSLGSIAVSNWCVASMDDYIAMFQNLGSQSSAVPKSYDNYVNAKITSAGGTALNDGDYWGYLCATEGWSFYYYSWDGDSERNDPLYDKYVRPVLGF